MQKILLTLLLTSLLLTTCSTKRRPKGKYKDGIRFKRLVKRFDDAYANFQYEDLLHQLPSSSNNIEDGFATKSNIPLVPEGLNTFQNIDDTSRDIPIGPLVQSDDPIKPEGGVHLKDLLSFIRKTNIPEDPFTPRSNIMSPLQYHQVGAPINSIDDENQARRFHIPTVQNQFNGFLPQQKRFYLQQLGYRYRQHLPLPVGYERKNIIPHNPSDQPKTLNEIKKSLISKPTLEDPYESLKKAIIIKAKIASMKQSKTKRNLSPSYQLPSDGNKHVTVKDEAMLDNKDAYEDLKRAISTKEEELHDDEVSNNTQQMSKDSHIPNSLKYNTIQQPSQTQKKNFVPEDHYTASFTKPSYVYNNEPEKKTEIPGITVEHNTRFNIDHTTQNQLTEQVRKDKIPDSPSSNQNIIDDANNEQESKRSAAPEPTDTKSKLSDIPNTVNPQVSSQFPGFPLPDSLPDATAQRASVIPSVQHTDENSQFITRSFIPHRPDDQQAVHYPLMTGYNPPIAMDKTSYEEPAVQLKSVTISSNDQKDTSSIQPTTFSNNNSATGPAPSTEGSNNTQQLPSNTELERTKIQREMNLINQLQNMKKSNIPYANQANMFTSTNVYDTKRFNIPKPGTPSYLHTVIEQATSAIPQQTSSTLSFQSKMESIPDNTISKDKKSTITQAESQFHDSTPIMLRVHPAEGSSNIVPLPNKELEQAERQEETESEKKSTISNMAPNNLQFQQDKVYLHQPYNMEKTFPKQNTVHEELMMKKFNIPVPDNKQTNVEFKMPLSTQKKTFESNKRSFIPIPIKIPTIEETFREDDDEPDPLNKQEQPLNQQEDQKEEETAEKRTNVPHIQDSYPLVLRVLPPT